jgi:hypothetical protein
MGTVTACLIGNEGKQEVAVEGLNESLRVQALLHRVAVEPGFRGFEGINAGIIFGSRMLRDTETLAEARIPPFGSVVDLCVCEGGGMPVPAGLEGQTINDSGLPIMISEIGALEAQLEETVSRLQEKILALESLQGMRTSGQRTLLPDCLAIEARSTSDSAESRIYVRSVIDALKKGNDAKDADARKEVEKQITALESIASVMEMRLRPAGDLAAKLAFDTVLDDDETLLCLMSEIDQGEQRDGTVSREELFASTFLKDDQSKDISRVFMTTFESDLPALENALSHLEESDFIDYRRPLKVDFNDTGSVFDRKASVQAVLDAAGAAMSSKSDQITTEVMSTGMWADRVSLEQLADTCKCSSEQLSLALKCHSSSLLDDTSKLDFLAIKHTARRVPRVAGQRMEWVGSMGLNAMLARHLPPGTLTDGLAGVRRMSAREAELALMAFVEDAAALFLKALDELRAVTGSKSAVEANGKFQGFEGSFASLKDFHAGAEATLKLGYPNPDIMRGILLEHTAHSSATRLYATTNYCIATNLLIEYWWAIFEDSPTDAAVRKRACEQLRKIRYDRSDIEPMGASALAEDAHPLFPGEVTDSFVQTLLVVTATAADYCSFSQEALAEEANRATGIKPVDKDANKRLAAAAREASGSVLSTDEERARGVAVIQRPEVLKWITVSSSILKTPLPAAKSSFEFELKHGAALVGVVLPMSAARAGRFISDLSNRVKSALEHTQQQQLVIGAHIAARKTVVFGSYAGIDALRSELDTLSLRELKTRAHAIQEADAPQRGLTSDMERAQLCEEIVASFVRTDLRADLEIALSNARECDAAALDSKVENLMRAWGCAPATASSLPEDWIKHVAECLDSEKRWSEVEGWVRLYCGRFQGRTRVGLKTLISLKAEELRRYNLRDGEVMALYIYTGASLDSKA